MCGIAGYFGFRNDDLIKQISRDLAHRGPDGEGFYIDDKVTLLNRRLAIIDRKGGDQPIYNEDKTLAVVYNGEIYNYRELREELKKKGHKFYTHSDTEIIVHGYEEWGEKSFNKYNGMFAIALYDKKADKLTLARDHFGIKPLYYAIIDQTNGDRLLQNNAIRNRFIFSSEIKPIINSGLIEKKPNDRIIYRYLKYRIHDDQKETFFKDIYKLMPGKYMTVQSSKLKVQSYSNLEKDILNIKEKQFVPEDVNVFRKHLIEAVTLRLMSEVPVGTCLSGGLDSSTVVSIVNKLLQEKNEAAKSVGKDQNSFSAVFPGLSNDEEEYIDELLGKLSRIQNYKVFPKPEEFFKDIKDFIKTQEEPTISTGPYAQYQVMREAAKHVTVLLDGQGSDEMMAGYLPYYFVYFRQLWKQKKYTQFLKEIIASSDVVVKYVFQKIMTVVGIKEQVDMDKLMNAKLTGKFKNEKFIISSHNLKKRLSEDIFHNSLPALLRYEDKNSMRFSIEGRVPFLDFNLLRFIFSLDDRAIIEKGWNKNILRQATEKLLPDSIRKRRNKIGFTTPEYDWFIKMKNRIYSIFMSESFAGREYFDQQEVLNAFQKFIEGKNTDTMVFWRILNIEMWLRQFFDVKTEKAEIKEKKMLDPNNEKKLEIMVNGNKYLRFPLRTELFQKGDNVPEKISKHLTQLINRLSHEEKYKGLLDNKWFVVVSEKVVAIAQGRSYFIWDINPGFFAKTLSRFVRKTPFGIGLGSPWTMQLAINEVGLLKILLASFVSFVTKPFGMRGIFYQIAGREAAAIDGPTEYSLYPSNVSAKLGPKDPQQVCEDIHVWISSKPQLKTQNFLGTVIIDANDIGRNILGNSTKLSNSLIEKIFNDNPMGQANEQTPLVLVAIN